MNRKDSTTDQKPYQLAGWLLFVLCALFFLASSLKNKDVLASIGSVLFLLSCIVFIIPLVRTRDQPEPGDNESD